MRVCVCINILTYINCFINEAASEFKRYEQVFSQKSPSSPQRAQHLHKRAQHLRQEPHVSAKETYICGKQRPKKHLVKGGARRFKCREPVRSQKLHKRSLRMYTVTNIKNQYALLWKYMARLWKYRALLRKDRALYCHLPIQTPRTSESTKITQKKPA